MGGLFNMSNSKPIPTSGNAFPRPSGGNAPPRSGFRPPTSGNSFPRPSGGNAPPRGVATGYPAPPKASPKAPPPAAKIPKRVPNPSPKAGGVTPRVPNGGYRPGAGVPGAGAAFPLEGQPKDVRETPFYKRQAETNKKLEEERDRRARLTPEQKKQEARDREKRWRESPLNPFGDKWGWAPWNQRGNPKSLNPGPLKDSFNPAPQPGEYPFESVPNPITVIIRVPSYKRFGKNSATDIFPWTSDGGYSKSVTGIPLGIIVEPWGADGLGIGIYLSYKTSISAPVQRTSILQVVPLSATPSGTGLTDGVPPYFLENGPELPSSLVKKEPIELPNLQPADPELLTPRMFEPEGFPEIPLQPEPEPAPRPSSEQFRPPSAAPRPRPLPVPNVPQPLIYPESQPATQPQTVPSPGGFPDNTPREKPWQNPLPGFPLSPISPFPMPPTIPRPQPVPSGKPEPSPEWISIRKDTRTVYDPLAPSNWQERPGFKAPSPVSRPAPVTSFFSQPQQDPNSLGQKIDKLSEQIEEKTRQGCRYKEDDLITANVTKFAGVEPITNTPQFTVVPVQVHEKLKDYIELQSGVLARIEGQADGLRGRVKRILDRLQIMRILNLMGAIASIHNAAMLSRNLGETLGEATSSVLNAIGRTTGFMSAEESIDVNQILGESFNGFMESTLGSEVWAGTKANWNRANRILSSASQIVWSIRSIADSQRAITEWIAENTGKIGNALKRFGVVGENAYGWMPEKVTARTPFQKKIDDFREGVDNLEDAASSLSSVAGEVISIQDEKQQLKQQWEEFNKVVKEGQPKTQIENDATKATATQSKTASQAKDISNEDIARSDNATP